MISLVFSSSFDVTVAGNSTLIPFKYVCNGEESDFSSCYLSTGQVCRQSDNALTTIAIECDSKCELTLMINTEFYHMKGWSKQGEEG